METDAGTHGLLLAVLSLAGCVGWLLCWLEDGASWTAAEFHEECASFTEEQRKAARQRLREKCPEWQEWFEAEGPLGDGEAEEPPGFW